jgi:hypothetical protein
MTYRFQITIGGIMKNTVPLAPLQRLAWFNVIVFAAVVVLYVIAVPSLALYFHKSLAQAALPALGLFGLCGIWGFGSHILYDRRGRVKVKLDEREELINLRATTTGFAGAWLVFVALCMGVWAVRSYALHRPTVPVDFLPFLVFVGMIVFTVFQSLAILAEYKRSCGDDTL